MRAGGAGAGAGLAPAGHGAGIGRLLPPVQRPDLLGGPGAAGSPVAAFASAGPGGEPAEDLRSGDPPWAARA
eukprot:15448035-Alexandrium_andersonii.AAC.1